MENPIRFVKTTDASQILSIYAPYITDTAISFETEVPNIQEFTRRIETNSAQYPWLVFEEKGTILGYAYATRHRQRDAYKWSVDVAVYLSPKAQGKGIGTQLYGELFRWLRRQGYFNAYAGIALPNEKSIGLHKKLGFIQIARYHRVGYKLGKWWNVSWWELELNVKPDNPGEPLPVTELLKML